MSTSNHLTLDAVLAQRAADLPDSVLVSFLEDGTAYTAAELYDLARRAASGVRKKGVSAGDRVALICSNRIEFLITFFGTLIAGGVPVPLNPALQGPMLIHMLRDSAPTLIVCEDTNFSTVRDAIKAAEINPAYLRITTSGTSLSVSGDILTDLLRTCEPLDEASDHEWCDLATILYTSGTTGLSKGVMVSHRMALGFADSVQWSFDLTDQDVTYSALPLFHVNGLFVTFLAITRAGGRAAIAKHFSASQFWHHVVDSKATILSLLGSMAPILMSAAPSPTDGQHSVRIANIVPEPPAGFASRFGLSFTSLYGMTDTGIPLGGPYAAERPSRSCGRPAPGWECRIVDEYDTEVPAGALGELVVRPKVPFLGQLGYWQRQDATVSAWRNLWFHTGDLFRADAHGWFYFVDRAKDAIRKSGENVSAVEVEDVIVSHADVAEVAVYAVPSDMGEDEVMAAVLLAPDSTLDGGRLVAYCSERLPYFAVPRYIDFVDYLPRTDTAKVRKVELRERGVSDSTFDAGPVRRKRSGPP